VLSVTYKLGAVRTTEYFERKIRDRNIRREWCESAVADPIATEEQDDGRLRSWAYIEEVSHYLRVITESDGTFVNAFFDRTFARRRAQ